MSRLLFSIHNLKRENRQLRERLVFSNQQTEKVRTRLVGEKEWLLFSKQQTEKIRIRLVGEKELLEQEKRNLKDGMEDLIKENKELKEQLATDASVKEYVETITKVVKYDELEKELKETKTLLADAYSRGTELEKKNRDLKEHLDKEGLIAKEYTEMLAEAASRANELQKKNQELTDCSRTDNVRIKELEEQRGIIRYSLDMKNQKNNQLETALRKCGGNMEELRETIIRTLAQSSSEIDGLLAKEGVI